MVCSSPFRIVQNYGTMLKGKVRVRFSGGLQDARNVITYKCDNIKY